MDGVGDVGSVHSLVADTSCCYDIFWLEKIIIIMCSKVCNVSGNYKVKL